MKQLIENFYKWKGEEGEEYVADEIHNFLGDLSRAEMSDIINYIIKTNAETNDKKTV